jgi:hypothetical protein
MYTMLKSIFVALVSTLRSRASLQMEILALRRQLVVLHFNVTEHPTAEGTAAQLVQAFPWDRAPRCLLRDRDSAAFRMQGTSMEIREVIR